MGKKREENLEENISYFKVMASVTKLLQVSRPQTCQRLISTNVSTKLAASGDKGIYVDKSQEKEEPEVFMRDTYLFGWQDGTSFLSRLFKWNTGHFTKEVWDNTKESKLWEEELEALKNGDLSKTAYVTQKYRNAGMLHPRGYDYNSRWMFGRKV